MHSWDIKCRITMVSASIPLEPKTGISLGYSWAFFYFGKSQKHAAIMIECTSNGVFFFLLLSKTIKFYGTVFISMLIMFLFCSPQRDLCSRCDLDVYNRTKKWDFISTVAVVLEFSFFFYSLCLSLRIWRKWAKKKRFHICRNMYTTGETLA